MPNKSCGNCKYCIKLIPVRDGERPPLWICNELADRMLKLCREADPELFRKAGPGCVRGKCPEGKMSCGRPRKELHSSMIEQTAEEIALRVNADEGEQLITNDGINCFTTWIEENGNIRCGIRGGENG